MDEATMTDADMAQREKIVKSMKKNFKDFRKRYGERAKEVMYATATKMAMKEDTPDVEQVVEGNPVNKAKKNAFVQKAGGRPSVADPNRDVPSRWGGDPQSPADFKRAGRKQLARRPVSGRQDQDRAPGNYATRSEQVDKGEYDYEGNMAKSSLRTIIRNAQMMHDMLDENTNLPEWVQGKITIAEDYIVSAVQYMQSEQEQ